MGESPRSQHPKNGETMNLEYTDALLKLMREKRANVITFDDYLTLLRSARS